MKENFYLFSGSSNLLLAEEISKILAAPLGKANLKTLPDNEILVEILEDVRGKDVFVLQSCGKNPSYYLMELLLMTDALKRLGARSIQAVMPYFCYSRQDKRTKGGAIGAKLVADLLEKSGVDGIITLNLHSEQTQGFFNIPVENLSALSLFKEEIKDLGANTVVVGPDMGSLKMVQSLAKDLNLRYSVLDKRRLDEKNVVMETLFGEVKDKDIILIDDISSTGDTLIKAASYCKKNGCKKIFAYIVHGLASVKIFENKNFEKFYFTNSILNNEYREFKNVKVLSAALLLANAIRSILEGKSFSSSKS